MSFENTKDWLESFRITAPEGPEQDLLSQPKNLFAKTISIVSGKGGVGKTTMAISLCKSLSRLGHKVLLLDCDYNLSNTSIKLNIPLNNNFHDLVTAVKVFDDCVVEYDGFHLLPGCNGSLELFNDSEKVSHFIVDIINEHRSEYDYILVDSPAGLQEDILMINAFCDHRIVILNPDKSSLTDAYSLIKVLKNKFGVNENHLIVNKLENKKQFQRVIRTISETAESFLNCRSIIIGGFPKSKASEDDFDNTMFKGKNNPPDNKILKLAMNLLEKCGGTTILAGSSSQNNIIC